MTTCNLPPEGWICTRECNHTGPCAAYTCLYDRDVMDVFVIEDKVHVEYYLPTQEGIFTKEDLEYLIKRIEEKDIEIMLW